mmetsp:Transcript_34277/g.86027  ORF Transcript_34277/g.86027 Transcript_34277/m.86027 type:complete len:213 (-) Transcript_34277:95-733(-)
MPRVASRASTHRSARSATRSATPCSTFLTRSASQSRRARRRRSAACCARSTTAASPCSASWASWPPRRSRVPCRRSPARLRTTTASAWRPSLRRTRRCRLCATCSSSPRWTRSASSSGSPSERCRTRGRARPDRAWGGGARMEVAVCAAGRTIAHIGHTGVGEAPQQGARGRCCVPRVHRRCVCRIYLTPPRTACIWACLDLIWRWMVQRYV